MKCTTIRQSIPALVLASTVVGPASGAFAAAKTTTFKGSTEQMHQWGPIRVSVAVKNKKITNVVVSSTAHTSHSVSIQRHALPILKQEVLKAQSAKINTVSGATDTSGAYISSLQAAIKKARNAKALK